MEHLEKNQVQFYNEYEEDVNLVPLVRDISWSKHVVILKKCKDSQQRQFYILHNFETRTRNRWAFKRNY